MWVKADEVVANDYNPNVMSSMKKNCLNIHWSRMDSRSLWWFGREGALSGRGWFSSSVAGQKADTRKRLEGWLPVTCINPEERDRHHVLPQPYGITVPGETPDNVNV